MAYIWRAWWRSRSAIWLGYLNTGLENTFDMHDWGIGQPCQNTGSKKCSQSIQNGCQPKYVWPAHMAHVQCGWLVSGPDYVTCLSKHGMEERLKQTTVWLGSQETRSETAVGTETCMSCIHCTCSGCMVEEWVNHMTQLPGQGVNINVKVLRSCREHTPGADSISESFFTVQGFHSAGFSV